MLFLNFNKRKKPKRFEEKVMALVNQAMAKEKIKPLNLFFENQMKNQILVPI